MPEEKLNEDITPSENINANNFNANPRNNS